MIFTIILCLLFILLFLFIPTHALFKILNLEVTDELIGIGLKISIGIIILILLAIPLRFSVFGFKLVWLLPTLSIGYFLSKNKASLTKPKINIKPYIFILIIILIGTASQNIVLFRGGWQVANGQAFPSPHDTMWNIALASELYHHFPPQHPGMAGVPLKNNHYFYPLFLSLVSFITRIDLINLYFRFGPVLISFLFGLSIYAVSTIFTKKYFWQELTVFLGYFSSNFAFFLPFFLGFSFNWKGDTFMANEPFSQIINPYSVLGFAFFLFSIFSLSKATDSKRQFTGWSLVTALFIGSLYGFKAFGGVVTILALALTFLYSGFVLGNFQPKAILFFSLTFFIPFFLLISEPGQTTLNWAPGWLLTEMMSGQDKLNLPGFSQIEAFYQSIGNTLGLIKIKLIELAIYTVGNLGVRLLGLYYLLKMVFLPKEKKPRNEIVKIYIFCSFLLAFFIPLLFNLGGTAYNIVQFTPYALVVLAVLTGVFMEEIFDKFKRNKKTVLGGIFIICLLILSLPVNIKNILAKLEMPADVIANEEVEALTFIKNTSGKNDVVLIDPSQFSIDKMYLSALSQRRLYLGSPDYAWQTRNDPANRLGQIDAFLNQDSDKSFLEKNNISYIYLLKPYSYGDLEKKLKNIQLKPVFENERVIIFGVN